MTADGGTKGARTRKRILDAAAAEITRNGPDGSSLRAIADAARLKTGSLYFHFASKDELVAAVLVEGVEESLRRLDDAIGSVVDPEDADAVFRAAVGAHLGALVELRDYAVAILAPRFLGAAGRDPAFRAARRTYLARWTAIIKAAQGAGSIASGLSPRAARDLIVGALNSASAEGTSLERTASAISVLLKGPERD